MSATLKINSDDLNDLQIAAETLGGAMAGREVFEVAGLSMEETIREHLRAISRDGAHHQSASSLGAEPTGFYEQAAEAVEPPQLEEGGVSVSIPHKGIAQRYFGGTIAAQPGSFLTIPARAESYGKRAGEFDNLRLIIFGDTQLAALVDKDEEKSGLAEGSVYYWLVRSVTQEGDESILPTDAEILDPALERVRSFIERTWNEKGGSRN